MNDTKKRLGRPPGTGAPAHEQRRVRAVRLNEARWAKLKELGTSWLEAAIDAATAPEKTTAQN